ncbi:MAG: hypothetical protein ABSA34_00545, partial [Candidatus Goldiibacteriota bacterium]
ADSIRYFTMLYVFFTALLVYMLARSVSASAFYAMLSSLFYTVFLNNYMLQGLGSYPQIFAQFPILASILFAVQDEKGYEHVNFFISGFFAAAALAVDTTAIFFILAPASYIFLYCGKKKGHCLTWFLAGFFSLIAAVSGWLLYKGIAREFFDSVIAYGAYFAASGVQFSAFTIIKLGAGMFVMQNIILLAGTLYAGVLALKKPSSGYNAMLFISFVVLFSGVMLFKALYPHYYLILTPVMALAAAELIKDAALRLKKMWKSALPAAAAAGVIICGIMVFQYYIMKTDLYLKTGRLTIDYYYDLQAAGRLINSSSDGIERDKYFLFAWPNMPELYFMTGSQAATKYIYSYPLELYKQDRDSVTGVLFNHRPVWAVLERGKYNAFQAYLDNYYRKEMETGTIAVYRSLLK